MPIYDCGPYVSQALAAGITQSQIDAFKASNTNVDGTWDCHRLLEAFYGSREVTVGSVSAAQAAVVASMPPIAQAVTSGGDQRMLLSLSGAPTAAGGGAPARQLAPIVAAGSGGFGSLFSITTPSGGIDFVKLLLIAGVAYAAWHFIKKGR
jgi:hypothetical protein